MKTLALVIGNNDYHENAKLQNAVNDAEGMKNIFEKLGFTVIYKVNGNTKDFQQLLEELPSKINEHDAFIFYFAGHGFQFEGGNYFAAIDCQIDSINQYECRNHSIHLTDITDIIKKAPTSVNIIIIDACRGSVGRGVHTHYSQINSPEGTIIAFSTSPGEGAKDSGMDGHSLYTGALLQYLGKEFISVEDLFKRVRKTVYNLSNKTQTTWEHTSLVGDYFFNTGQMVHSLDIPYAEDVVKDKTFNAEDNEVDKIIIGLKSCDWNEQNPAIKKFAKLDQALLDKNKLFIIGRNILQCSEHANDVIYYIKKLDTNIQCYCNNNNNHLLNGMLFEIYFNRDGEFRHDKLKKYSLEHIFSLRNLSHYKKSFEFINNTLEQYKDELYYIPSTKDTPIDVDIKAKNDIRKVWEKTKTIQVIDSMIIQGKEIKNLFAFQSHPFQNEKGLKEQLSKFLVAPERLINIVSTVPINSFYIYADEEQWF